MGLGWDGFKILSFHPLCTQNFPPCQAAPIPSLGHFQGWKIHKLSGMEALLLPELLFILLFSFLTLHSPDSTGAEHTSKIPDFSPKSQVQDCVRRSHWISRFPWDLNFLFPLLEGSCMSLGLLILVMQRQQR